MCTGRRRPRSGVGGEGEGAQNERHAKAGDRFCAYTESGDTQDGAGPGAVIVHDRRAGAGDGLGAEMGPRPGFIGTGIHL